MFCGKLFRTEIDASEPTYRLARDILDGWPSVYREPNLQLESLRYQKPGVSDLLNLAYEYVAPNGGNNGQISKIRYFDSPGTEVLTKTETFQYDAWSRLANAQTQDTNNTQPNTWALTWQYDRYGNRLNQNITAGSQSVTAPQLTISTATNRITTAGFAYDAAGNLTNDAIHTYAYDAENRIKAMDSTAVSYGYDNSSLRMSKIVGSTSTFYLFSGSKVIAEYVNGSLNKEYIYAGSQLLATIAGSTTTYHYRDHLSNRVEADASGNVTRKSGHLPFGDNWYEQTVPAGGPVTKLKFTSYERDGESNLDYAVFRYDSSRLGRFMSPDKLAGSPGNPQSLNRYVYALNIPSSLVDPLGLDAGFDCGPNCVGVDGGSGIPVDLAFFLLGGFLIPPRIVPLIDTNSEGFLLEINEDPDADCAGKVVSPAPNVRVQSDSNGKIIAVGIDLTGDSGFMATPGGTFVSIPPHTSVGGALESNGAFTIKLTNPMFVKPGGVGGLMGAYISSATFDNGSFSQVNGAVAIEGVALGSKTTPSSFLQGQLNQNSQLTQAMGVLQSAAKLLQSLLSCGSL